MCILPEIKLRYNSYIENGENQKWCYDSFLNYRSLRQAKNVRKQLEGICRKLNIRCSEKPKTNEHFNNIRKCILCGFFSQVAHADKIGKGLYMTVKDHQSVKIHPSSVIQYNPEWVMYNEFVLTQSNFIRTLTSIEPEWY